MKEDIRFPMDIVNESCLKTREMFNVLMELQQALKSSSSVVVNKETDKLHLLQKEVMQIDLILSDRLKNGPPLSATESYALAERTELQKEILQLNKKLIPQIHNIKSTLASEMASLKTGRTALKGYGDSSRGAGRLINKSG